MSEKKKIVFNEYYQMYLAAHKHPATKLLHFLGQVATVLFIWAVIKISLVKGHLLFGYLWFAPNVVYFFAWPAHWWIEKNEPLAYTNKWYAKLSDFRMFYDVLTGKVKLDTRDK